MLNFIKSKNKNIIKYLVLAIFFIAIFLQYFLNIFATNINARALSFSCVILCFVFTLFFVQKDKNIFISIGLFLNCIADIFLVLYYDKSNFLAGVSVFLFVQLFYAIYTVMLNKSRTAKIVNISLRSGLSIIIGIVGFIAKLTLYEIFSLIYIANFVLSCIYAFIHFKTELFYAIGSLIYICCDVFVGIPNGGAKILGFSGSFIDFLYSFDMAFVLYIPGVFVIALQVFYASFKYQKTN